MELLWVALQKLNSVFARPFGHLPHKLFHQGLGSRYPASEVSIFTACDESRHCTDVEGVRLAKLAYPNTQLAGDSVVMHVHENSWALEADEYLLRTHDVEPVALQEGEGLKNCRLESEPPAGWAGRERGNRFHMSFGRERTQVDSLVCYCTVRVTLAVMFSEPEVPVTVTL